MVFSIGELELSLIDQMSRRQLVEAIRARQDCLPADLTDRLEEQSTDYLQLVLLTARLINVLRRRPFPNTSAERGRGTL